MWDIAWRRERFGVTLSSAHHELAREPQQSVHLDGLGDVSVEAGHDRAVAIGVERVPGQSDRGHARRASFRFGGSDRAHQLVSVGVRHREIAQQEIRGLARPRLDRFGHASATRTRAPANLSIVATSSRASSSSSTTRIEAPNEAVARRNDAWTFAVRDHDDRVVQRGGDDGGENAAQ